MNRSIEFIAASNKKIFVVCYYRKSSAAYDSQISSIPDQQKACRDYCAARGWVIVAEYIDNGKSGSKEIEKRIDFHRMIADAAKGGFTAVVVWDTSRFGRLDALDGAVHKNALRQAGVHLESVKQGTIDWSTSMGRIQDVLYAESDHKYSTDLSANSIRGRLSTIENGYWPHGMVPFGFDRQYFCDGVAKMVVPRSEKFRKPLNWKLRLIINESEACTVRWMLEEIGVRDGSVRAIARQLGERGILTPDGKQHWSVRSVREVLSNPAYAGFCDCNNSPERKNKKLYGKFGRTPATHKAGGCPAIVSVELFDRVQATIKSRSDKKRIVRNGKLSFSGALSGCLICGNCGHSMVKKRHPKYGTYYVCISPSVRPTTGCRQWRIYESALLPHLVGKLIAAVDFQLIKNTKVQPVETAKQDRTRLVEQIADAEKAITVGKANLFKAVPEVFGMLQEQLIESKAELDRLRNTLALLTGKPDDVDAIVKWWESVKDRLVPVCDVYPADAAIQLPGGGRMCLAPDVDAPKIPPGTTRMDVKAMYSAPTQLPLMADVTQLRALLVRLNVSCTLWFKPNGTRFFSLERGILRAEFQPDQITLENFPNGTENTPG